jgi:hypothetical protein
MFNKLFSITFALALATASFAFGPVNHPCGARTTYENQGDAAHDIKVQFTSCASRDCEIEVTDRGGNITNTVSVPAGQTKTFHLAVPKGGSLRAMCSGKEEEHCTTTIE